MYEWQFFLVYASVLNSSLHSLQWDYESPKFYTSEENAVYNEPCNYYSVILLAVSFEIT